jgi:hypothetical protein
MVLTRLRNGRAGRRIDQIDGFSFPAGVRHHVGLRHPDLSHDDIRQAEAAARQWFRLVARDPRARLWMPSVVVDHLWHELTRHEREYAAFCDAAFGRPLPHQPETAAGEANAAQRAVALLTTLRLARRDGNHGSDDLPLLFRVDHELRVRNGNRYLVDCGGRGECFEVPRMECLRHLGGPGRRRGPRGIRGFAVNDDSRHGYGGGAGGAGHDGFGGFGY